MPAINPDLSRLIYSAAILIVEDNEINRIFLLKILGKHGFTNILAVASAAEALNTINGFRPELVLLDIMMPGIDGFECCRMIREHPQHYDLPILIQTAITEPELRVKAFACGATDFVSKPIYPDELCARVIVHLENRLYLRKLQGYKERIDIEMASARQLQQAILPSAEEIAYTRDHCHLDIASYFQPSSEIGGDFWGLKSISLNETALWIVDFSGHGVPAALNSFRLQAYLKERSNIETRPGEYLSSLNEKLLQLLMHSQFSTMFYCIIDTKRNHLVYSAACNPNPIIISGNSNPAETLNGSGIPLGVSMMAYESRMINFFPEDILFLYSDALTETINSSGKYLSEESVIRLLSEHKEKPAAEIMEELLTHFRNNYSLPTDDLTLCLCKRENRS